MPHIRGTNIIVDDFRFASRNKIYKNFIYFLSHFHADHYRGLTSSFDLGMIYATEQTAALMVNKFPGVEGKIVRCEYNKEYELILKAKKAPENPKLESNQKKLSNSNEETDVKHPLKDEIEDNSSDKDAPELKCTFVFMDANHIIGSSMILFTGYFGNILYTGDMRYHDKLIKMNWPLFKESGEPKMQIDELILDNTYCDPIFAFPSQEKCVEIIKEIIEKARAEYGKKLQVHLYSYTVGKEEICLELAMAFKTKIVLDNDRFKMIKRLNYHPNFFTKDKGDGFIFMSKGVNSSERVIEDGSIHISLTGWINCSSYLSLKKDEYLVAYSSHSNYQELDRFVSLIRPGVLSNIVIEKELELNPASAKHLGNYFFSLKNMKQRGFQLLRNKYTDINRVTPLYAKYLDPENLTLLYQSLDIDKTTQEICTKLFFEENKQFLESREKGKDVKKGVKYSQGEMTQTCLEIHGIGKDKKNVKKSAKKELKSDFDDFFGSAKTMKKVNQGSKTFEENAGDLE